MTKRKPARLWAYQIEAETRDAVREVGALVLPDLDEVLDDFYDTIMKTPDWAGFFPTPDLREHAKSKQKEHWVRMFTEDFSQAYFESAERVGRVHFRVGLPLSHYVAAYSRVSLTLQAVVLKKCRGRFGIFGRKESGRLIEALSRVLTLDTEVAISAFHQAQTDAYADRMEALGQQFEREVGRVVNVLNGSMHQVGDAATGMDSEISQARAGAESLSMNAAQIAESAQSVAAAIEKLSASITSITKDVGEAVTASSSASAEATASVAQVGSLQSAAEEIGEVVNLIAEIAKQTNLLAVNATVEASRAGDAGKGFAVVAYEVKALAARISQATGSISERIKRIQSEAGLMADRMASIGECVGRMQSYSDGIRVAVDEQKLAAESIGLHADSTASSTNAMAGMIHDVTALVDRSGDTARVLNSAVSTASGEAGTLSDRVHDFLSSLRSA